jgi:ArsR family transcriptional regulator
MSAPSLQLQSLKAEFFRALAHPVRIRLLEVLTARGEMSVQELQHALQIDQPIVSQQLARLKASGIVVATRQGTIIRYAVADPLIEDLLRLAKQILNRRLVGVRSLLQELKRDSGVRGGSPSP